MPNPISHAEMIAALRFAIQLSKGESFDDCADDLRRVLTHLERTQPTDTQADLTKRASALVEEFRAYLCNLMIDLDEPEIEWMTDKLAAALQSEREAAAEALRTPFTKALIAKVREDAAAEARRAAIALLRNPSSDMLNRAADDMRREIEPLQRRAKHLLDAVADHIERVMVP